MTRLLEIRQHLSLFYLENERILSRVFRFLFGFIVFYFVNFNLGMNRTFTNPIVSIVLAVVCALLPWGAISPIMCICLLAQFYASSIEVTIAALCIFMIMILSYYIFKCGNSWIMALTVLLCMMKMPGILVISLGLIASPIAIVPASFGVFIGRMIEMMKIEYSTLFSQAETAFSIKKMAWFFLGIFEDANQLLLLAAIVVIVLLVYGIRRLSVDYSWPVAITVGTIGYLMIMLLGNFALDIKVNIGLTLVNALFGVAASLVLYLFLFAVDYSRTEYVQFEDDDYYYYVKAVPKLSIAAEDKKVKQITGQMIPGGSQSSLGYTELDD